jgi:hypothetical protein
MPVYRDRGATDKGTPPRIGLPNSSTRDAQGVESPNLKPPSAKLHGMCNVRHPRLHDPKVSLKKRKGTTVVLSEVRRDRQLSEEEYPLVTVTRVSPS